jgi:hypothetical protein
MQLQLRPAVTNLPGNYQQLGSNLIMVLWDRWGAKRSREMKLRKSTVESRVRILCAFLSICCAKLSFGLTGNHDQINEIRLT